MNLPYRQSTPKLFRPNTAVDYTAGFVPGYHFDIDIEAAVLGACLLERNAYGQIYSLLEPEHFYKPEHQEVYRTMQEMYSEGLPIDLLTVTYCINRKQVAKLDGLLTGAFICQLCQDVVTGAHVEAHAVILRELHVERELRRIQAEAGSGEGDALEKALKTQEAIQKALSLKSTDDWRDLSEVMISLSNHRENVKGKDLMGVTSGLPTIDRMTYGLQPTQLIVIGARPSVGKTAFAGEIALSAAKAGAKVGIINLEMPEEQVGARLLSLYSDQEFWRIYRNRHEDAEQERRLLESMSNISGLPIYLSTRTNVSGSAIRAKANKLLKRTGLDLLIIDYLQLIEAEGKASDNREREIAKLSRSLKLLAMDLKIPVVILCQLNRESDKAGDKKPRMSQIRESGAIEQDADVVMLLHRDWKSGLLTNELTGQSTEREADVIIEKNRNGETGKVNICFSPDTMRFYEEVYDPFLATSNPF